MLTRARTRMQGATDPGADSFGHYAVQQQMWEMHRKKLQMSMERERQRSIARGRAQTADSATRANIVGKHWREEDKLCSAAERVEAVRGSREASLRSSDDQSSTLMEMRQRGAESARHRANQRNVEQREEDSNRQREWVGEQHWKRGMAAGAEEVALAQRHYARDQAAAVREFAWADADRKRADTRAAALSARLPTGPGKLDHHQRPSTWRADLMSPNPGRWTTHPTDAERARAKAVQRRAHGNAQRAQVDERAKVDAVLDRRREVEGECPPPFSLVCSLPL
jgi:hypothetical protein